MKKIAIIFISCMIPFLSFAAVENTNPVDSFQELCAKEKDPIKRQNYCHILDKYSQAAININGLLKETVTV